MMDDFLQRQTFWRSPAKIQGNTESPFSESYYIVFSAGHRPGYHYRFPGGKGSEMMEPERVRSEFPETWLWSDTVMG